MRFARRTLRIMTRNAQRSRRTLALALAERGISDRAAGVAMGRSVAYAHRRLNGEVPMTIDDLEALAAVAGLEVHIELVPAGGA